MSYCNASAAASDAFAKVGAIIVNVNVNVVNGCLPPNPVSSRNTLTRSALFSQRVANVLNALPVNFGFMAKCKRSLAKIDHSAVTFTALLRLYALHSVNPVLLYL